LNSTVDISISGLFQIIGWVVGVIGILSIIGRIKENPLEDSIETSNEEKDQNLSKESPGKWDRFKGVKLLSLGLVSTLTLNYFAFSSPTVISRWTGGDYITITIIIAVMIALSIFLLTYKPELLEKLNSRLLWAWNGLFVLFLVLTIAVHTFPFPANPVSNPVVISYPLEWYFYLPLAFMIGLLPIIFIDFTLLSRELLRRRPTPSKLGGGFGVANIVFILIAFILIFTNVWGYVEPVSNIFRNLFWLPFLIAGVTIPIMGKAIFKKQSLQFKTIFTSIQHKRIMASYLAILLIGTAVSSLAWELRPKEEDGSSLTSIRVMTYNIQQGVNVTGDRNYDKQLALIKEVNPDIIGLQESDPARISGGTSDVVRYFANRLNYYSFYGPRTVTGTYGAAILSRYPITNAKTFFTYSDEDEIGTTEVQVRIGTTIFNVFVSHPAGSDDAKLAHITSLMDRIGAKTHVISMGDFNSRQDSIYYNMSVSVLQDSWLEIWPTGIDDTSLDMSNRIDHIFVSMDITVLETRFITDPQSDHPALWTEISF
jgi:endonuclease/exonuclease/phosphatase family metal-dependent hydrolase